jgi:DNA-binding response OmpR family regulator
MNILLVGADQVASSIIVYVLHRHGHQVTVIGDSVEALRRSISERLDLVLLDANHSLDVILELCRTIRRSSPVPLVILNSPSDEVGLVASYEAGADDCVVKPFSARHLLVRIQAVMRRIDNSYRRHDSITGGQIRIGDLSINLASFEAEKNGILLHLTRLEFRILCCMVENTGNLVSAHRLADYAWQAPTGGDIRMLKTHVSHLRHKLRDAGGMPMQLRAIPRTGYIFTAPERSQSLPDLDSHLSDVLPPPGLDGRTTAIQPLHEADGDAEFSGCRTCGPACRLMLLR